MKRAKLISDTEAGKIIKLPDGRFRIDCKDSRGRRHRPAFATKDEAAAALGRIAAKKANGEFLADGANTTFAKPLDLLLERNEREGLAKASRLRVESIINARVRPVLGARRLSEFPAQRMRFVQEWFDDLARNESLSSASLMHVRSAIKMALDEAIRAGLLGAPNPVTEFGLRVPQFVKRNEREVLTLEEISTLVRTSLCRVHGEWEETFCARFMLVLLGLLAGLRDGECCGLYWDCLDFEDRTIHVRRTWRKGVGIIAETKTGKSGYRSVPMSPILFAALRSYADRLRHLGYKPEGQAPVLVSGRVGSVTPNAITGNHWPAIARKAGFIEEAEAITHTFYALRHTAANLWRTIGIPTDRLMTLMGHTDYHTTVQNYLHQTPHFEVIRREVEALGLERTPAGYIDALGFVLARRWRDEGIEIECAPPRSATPLIGYEPATQDPKMLPGTTIDLVPNGVSIEAPAEPVNPYSLEGLRVRQRARAKERHAQGWTKERIAAELGVDRMTVSNWLRTADNIRWMRKASRAERAELIARCHQLRDQNPEWSSTQIAKELGVHPGRVTLWERGRGKPMPHRPGNHKIGKYEKRIREMLAAGVSTKQMARELDGPSHSGIAYFINRMGLREQVPGARPRGTVFFKKRDNSIT